MHAIPKMVAPSDKRPSIWRGGILQVHVTRACDLSCIHCSQGSNLAGKPAMMSPEQFDAALASLEGYFGVVGMFGGNPTMHPQFGELCRIMRARVPYLQRGLWCNNLRGKGADARITFNPKHSNLNTHLSEEARDEFLRDWPESAPFIKGMDRDSIHSSPWVSPTDLGIPEDERWKMIGECDINRHWSAMICVVRGQLVGFFCEIAGAMAMLHQDNPDWSDTGSPMPDVGTPIVPGWWKARIETFEPQILTCCGHCGIPLRRPGQLAIGGDHEESSITHAHIARPKTRDRPVQMIESIGMVGRPDRPATNYLPGVTPGYKGD